MSCFFDHGDSADIFATCSPNTLLTESDNQLSAPQTAAPLGKLQIFDDLILSKIQSFSDPAFRGAHRELLCFGDLKLNRRYTLEYINNAEFRRLTQSVVSRRRGKVRLYLGDDFESYLEDVS